MTFEEKTKEYRDQITSLKEIDSLEVYQWLISLGKKLNENPLSKEKQKSECFRVLDPLSQKIMAIRSDITSQIARISCGSLFLSKSPLKLCYSVEVL